MKIRAAFAIAPVSILAGCATSRGAATVTPPTVAESLLAEPSVAAPTASVAVDVETPDAVLPSFPRRLTSAETPPEVELLDEQITAELGGQARLALRLCVGGDGGVTRADVDASSGIRALDDAFSNAARAWRYEALAAPDATVCQRVDIAYRVPRPPAELAAHPPVTFLRWLASLSTAPQILDEVDAATPAK